MNQFVDIRITGFDETKTHNPDKSKCMYDIYFNLSASPPSIWNDMFKAERRFPRHTMWRRARVVGSYIVVHATLKETEMHLDDLRTDVANSNQHYREYLERQAQKEAQHKAHEDAEKKKLLEVKGNLSFDDAID